jgi:hypothetical protein
MRLQGLASVGLLGFVMTGTVVAGPGQAASATHPNVQTSQVVMTAELRSIPRGQRKTADPSTAGGGAVVLKGFPCGVAVPGGVVISTTVSHSVATPSGNAAISCHAKTQITPPQAIVVRDAPCATLNGSGTDSHLVLTPSGRMNFWCHQHR